MFNGQRAQPSTHLQLRFQFLALRSIESSGGDDFADNLTTVRRHDQLEGVDDGIQSVQATILGNRFKQKSGGCIIVDFCASILQSGSLNASLDSWVDKQVLEGWFAFHFALEAAQVLLNGI